MRIPALVTRPPERKEECWKLPVFFSPTKTVGGEEREEQAREHRSSSHFPRSLKKEEMPPTITIHIGDVYPRVLPHSFTQHPLGEAIH